MTATAVHTGHKNDMTTWPEIGCQRGCDTHAHRMVDVQVGDHGYSDLPAVPDRLRRSFQMAIWDVEHTPVDGGPYCPARDAVSETILSHCQPLGTMVRVLKSYPKGQGFPGGPMRPQDVPIEEVSVGDQVLSWNAQSTDSSFRRRGRSVTDIAARPYDGRLVVVSARGQESRYTPEHLVLTRLGQRPNSHVVYMMRQGDYYRIGSTYWTRPSEQFGPRSRAVQEGADAFWILSVHDSMSEARLHELLTSVRFGIPGVVFARRSERDAISPFPLEDFWSKLGPNRSSAEPCLRHFGRLIDCPLMTKAEIVETNEHYTKWTRGKTIKGAIVTAAANLMDGMSVCVDDQTRSGTWEPSSLRDEWYSGPVFSLNVADDHTYIADGIVTHNCIWEPAETILTLAVCESAAPGSVVVDIGAQIGWFSLLAMSCGLEVLAIDADAENLRLLRESAEANAWTGVLATSHGRLTPDSPVMHAAGYPPIRLIKIDIEGAEDEAVRMFWPSIEAGRVDHLLIEVSPVFADYYPALVQQIVDVGYRAYQLPGKSRPPARLDVLPGDLSAPLNDLGRDGLADLVASCHQTNLWFARDGATW